MSAVAGGVPGVIGERYEDGSGHSYLPMFRQPVLVYAGDAILNADRAEPDSSGAAQTIIAVRKPLPKAAAEWWSAEVSPTSAGRPATAGRPAARHRAALVSHRYSHTAGQECAGSLVRMRSM
jgi:hypothetical protein